MNFVIAVAPASVALSRSETVTPVSTATGVDAVLLPSMNAVVPAVAVTTGASFCPVTLTSLLDAVLLLVASFTTKLTVRVVVSGFSEVFK